MITYHHKLPVSMFSNMSPSQTMSTRTCRVNSPMYMLEMVNGEFPHFQIGIFKSEFYLPRYHFFESLFPGVQRSRIHSLVPFGTNEFKLTIVSKCSPFSVDDHVRRTFLDVRNGFNCLQVFQVACICASTQDQPNSTFL